KSAAAPRVAPTRTASADGGRRSRNCRAASSRTAAEVDAIARSMNLRAFFRLSRGRCRACGDLAALVPGFRQRALDLAARGPRDSSTRRHDYFIHVQTVEIGHA